MSPLFFFAEGDGPHISLKPEPIAEIGNFTLNNSLFYAILVATVFITTAIYFGKKASVKPQRGFMAFLEMAVNYVIGMLEGVFGNRKQAIRFAPIFGVYFVFIFVNNSSGLMPWVGEGVASGATPAFRPFTADLNGVLALSVFSITAVQFLAIRENGFLGHLKHYFTANGDNPFDPINIFVGLLEVLGEFTRVISLSLRLFLNTAIGEILVSVFLFISGPATPIGLIPIILFELLVAYIQSYVFTVLSATYLAMAISHDDHDSHVEHPDVVNQAEPALVAGEAH